MRLPKILIVLAITALCANTALGLVSDLTGDGIVDFSDFAVMANEWLQEEVRVIPGYPQNLSDYIECDIQNTLIWQDLTHKCPSLTITEAQLVTPEGIWFIWRSGSQQKVGLFNGYRIYERGSLTQNSPNSWISVDAMWQQVSTGYLFVFTRENNTLRRFERSIDGGKTWTTVLDSFSTNPRMPGGNYITRARSFVDMGDKGLLFLDYTTDATIDNKIFYSSNNGASWQQILYVPGAADNIACIRHFHGGHYDEQDKILYLFTGDTDRQSGILVCRGEENIDDFLSGESSWQTNWKAVWGIADNARSTLDPAYCLNDNIIGTEPNSQRYRVVDWYIEKKPGEDKYAYWGVDMAADVPYAATMQKYNLTNFLNSGTKTITTIGQLFGEGFGWSTNNGVPIMHDRCFLGQYHNNGKAQIYALNSNRESIQVVGSWPLEAGASAGYMVPLGDVSFLGGQLLSGVFLAPEQLWRYAIGNVVPLQEAYRDYLGSKSSVFTFTEYNLMPNPLFMNVSQNDAPVGWTYANNATIKRDSTIVEEGRQYSIKINPNAQNNQNAFGSIDLDATNFGFGSLQGNAITFSMMVYLPSNLSATQKPSVRLEYTMSGVADRRVKFLSSSDFDGRWHLVVVTIQCPFGITNLAVYLYANQGPHVFDAKAIYGSSPRLVRGYQPGGEGILNIADF